MSDSLPKMPEPVYIFWSADTLHIRLWTADPERAARFAADTGATATVYVPKQEVQEAARQAMERAAKVCDERAETHHDLHTMNDKSIYWFDKAAEDRECADAIRALPPQDTDHLAGVGNMVEAPASGNGEE